MFSLILDFKKVGYNNPCDGSALAGRPPERVSVMVGLTRPLQSQGLQRIACWYSFLRSYPLILFPLKRFICVMRQNSQKKSQHCIQCPHYSKVCSLILDFKKVGYNSPCVELHPCGCPPFSPSVMVSLSPSTAQGLLKVSCGFSFLGVTRSLLYPLKRFICVIRQNSDKEKPHCIQWPYYSKVCSLILDFKKVGYNNPRGRPALAGRPPLKWVNITAALTEPLLSKNP